MKIEEIKEALSKPFPDKMIKFRKGSGNQMLPYVTAHIVEQRLDNSLGFENWDCEYYEVAGKVYCKIGIKTDDGWLYKSDAGAESNFDPEKGQASDAFKRAAKKFGVGRHLWLCPPKYNQ